MTNNDITLTNNKPQIIWDLTWVANYADGSRLEQFDPETGKENLYKDIDRESLERFDLIDKKTKKAVYAMYLREGQQLIFRRRTLKKLNGTPDRVIFLVGYQMTFMTPAGPKAHIVINYIHPDGSIALDGARNNLELLQFEY